MRIRKLKQKHAMNSNWYC